MKAPRKPSPPKPTPGKSAPKKGGGGGGFNVNQAMQMANTSIDAFKSFVDYKKEEEVTKRTVIEGQRQILLGEQQLKEAELEDDQHKRDHWARMQELSNQSREADQQYDIAMTTLETKADREDRVLKQLESGKITAEDAAMLLGGGQE
ncbi:hypothetical protein [Pseudomonas zeae]|jgi:capsule polysaccharide export protein KpsE/RkpR|uniref:Uncharacterized protein n=1 Tax=Pseudomonas zeae TaxID=2745510 RepID=A0A9E6T8Z6_9PSED|nr:hypothetical protein [Pseudomonas zeae]QXI09174.1 hypothetical protein HU754_015045 [Pseudomonas zeae]